MKRERTPGGDDSRLRDVCRVVLLRRRAPLWRLHVYPFLVLHALAAAALAHAVLTYLRTAPALGVPANATDPADPADAGANATAAADESAEWRSALGAVWLGEACAVPLALAAHAVAWLATHWSVGWRCRSGYHACAAGEHPAAATHVRVDPLPHRGKSEICALQHPDGEPPFFLYQRSKYAWEEERGAFGVLEYPCDRALAWYAGQRGHSEAGAAEARKRYGANTFDVPPATFWQLYREHAVAPFFAFQMACVALWSLDEHPQYALFMLGMLLLFEATVVQSRLRNGAALRAMLERPAEDVHTLRGGVWRRVPSSDLAPGDIVLITRTQRAPADCVLLSGTAVVNEAMLTGESTPHLKEAVDAACEDALDDASAHKVHVVYAGTQVIQAAAGAGALPGGSLPEGGCVAYVLRTGFETSQGRLVRTIAFASEHSTAASAESIAFIAFLLVFALAASAYVLRRGLADPRRSRWKLVVECSLIITSVVPPELPMELSLAVNTSLLALRKLGIFCTEPFRITLAGRVSVCCFDKTGTLTSDAVRFAGVLDSLAARSQGLVAAAEASDEAQMVLAGCHSLAHAPGGAVIGDPAETAALRAASWTLPHKEPNTARRGQRAVRILHRWAFSSHLRRMATIAHYSNASTTKQQAQQWFVAVKGAPEAVRPLLAAVPDGYDSCCRALARDGGRVLALAMRQLSGGERESAALVAEGREAAESALRFVGFAVFESPVKPDAGECVSALRKSSHSVVMVTGDHVLTSCHVAQALGIVRRDLLVAARGPSGALAWARYESDSDAELKASIGNADRVELCVSGETLDDFLALPDADVLLWRVRVFARVSPDQKERVVAAYRATGRTVLMCGDGTNDVGALKQAQVGIALLNVPESAPPSPQAVQQQRDPRNARMPPRSLAKMLEEAQQETDDNGVARLGDASVASPFTSRASSPAHGVTHVLAQGRATLAATTQVYRVLALNCLITAYTLSALYFDGVKMGDTQATCIGMIVAICFLFVSRSQPPMLSGGAPSTRRMPLPVLSHERPVESFFHPTVVVSVVLQSLIHLLALMGALELSRLAVAGTDMAKMPDPDDPFTPTLVNSVVFLVSCAMQVSTFAVNHRGRPFTSDLTENKGLMLCLGALSALTICGTLELSPDWNKYFELVPLPSETFRWHLAAIIAGDVTAAWLVDRLVLGVYRLVTRKSGRHHRHEK